MYKTVLVLLDGSTLTVRCREPKAMLQVRYIFAHVFFVLYDLLFDCK